MAGSTGYTAPSPTPAFAGQDASADRSYVPNEHFRSRDATGRCIPSPIARNFVTLDNFLVSGNGSADGWHWSLSAQTNDFMEQSRFTVRRGAQLGNFWGANRNINMGYATSTERHAESSMSPADPDLLPGAHDIEEVDGPRGEEGKGNIWDAALRRGLTVRNYGCWGLVDWTGPLDRHPVLVHDPFTQKMKMFSPTAPSLIPLTDLYYRGWDPHILTIGDIRNGSENSRRFPNQKLFRTCLLSNAVTIISAHMIVPLTE